MNKDKVAVLYHGTTLKAYNNNIKEIGVTPQGESEVVTLTNNFNRALEWARKKEGVPVVLVCHVPVEDIIAGDPFKNIVTAVKTVSPEYIITITKNPGRVSQDVDF